ncbi:MAG: NAD(P)(+) transhydrogenase (Re/Si-specific) subunit alpha, partial [Pseudomonadota bacterium]
MTIIGAPRETFKGENRVAMTPQSAVDLQKLGFECIVEKGAGAASGFSDASYREVGVTIAKSATELW